MAACKEAQFPPCNTGPNPKCMINLAKTMGTSEYSRRSRDKGFIQHWGTRLQENQMETNMNSVIGTGFMQEFIAEFSHVGV